MPLCIVDGCPNRSYKKSARQLEIEKELGRTISFHKFPADAHLRSLWLKAIKQPEIDPDRSKICSQHFVPDQLERNPQFELVKPNAVPTIFPDPQHQVRSSVRPSREEKQVQKRTNLFQSGLEKLKILQKISKSKIPIHHSDSETEPLLSGASSLSCPTTNEASGSSSTTNFRIPDAFPTSGTSAPPLLNPTTPQKRKKESEDIVDDTPRKKKLRARLAECRQKYQEDIRKLKNEMGQQMKNLKKKLTRKMKKEAKLKNVIRSLRGKNLLNEEQLSVLSSLSEMETEILKRQAAHKKKAGVPKEYGLPLKKFALTLHYYSPKAYRYVRDTFDSALPHPRTLYQWYQQVNGAPGFTAESFEILKKMTESTGKPTYAALSLDEMSIRRRVELAGGKYYGYVDMGTGVEGDDREEAKAALVFMLVGLNGTWKIPVGYFLIASVSGEQKAGLVRQCLLSCHDSYVIVKTLTTDGVSSNKTMAVKLGCSFTNVDEGKFWFPHPATREKIYFFFDTCHMIKLMRNVLARDLNLTDPEGREISWQPIVKLVELQEQENFHLANKLRKKHIDFKSQIMKVKLAAQVLSNSVADALECCEDLEIPGFENVSGLINFLRIINNVFDVSNSRNFQQKGYKRPLTKSNFESTKDFLEESATYLAHLKLDRKLLIKTELQTGALGLIIFCKNIISLFMDLCSGLMSPMDFIITYKISQDHIEIFFGILRLRGFLNNNPSSRELQSAYRKTLVHSEIKATNNGNCIPLDNIPILGCSPNPVKVINATSDRNRCIEEEDEKAVREIIAEEKSFRGRLRHDQKVVQSDFCKVVSTYVAGVVTHLILKTLKCEECAKALRSSKTVEYTNLIRIKDRGGLITPPSDVVRLVATAESFLQMSIKEKVKEAPKKKAKKVRANEEEFLDVDDDIDPFEFDTDDVNDNEDGTAKSLVFTRTVPQLVSKVMNYYFNDCQACKLFPCLDDHFYDTEPLYDHKFLLIKALCSKYLRIRVHYICESINNKTISKRMLRNKLTLFQGK